MSDHTKRQQSPFFQEAHSLSEIVTNSLIETVRFHFETETPFDHHLIIEALDYVSLLVDCRFFDGYFQTTLRSITFDVCFLLLQCSVEEYHELQEEPEQYVYMVHD